MILPGIGQSRADLVDENGNKIGTSFPMQLDKKALIRPVAFPALLMMITRMDLGFTKAVAKGVRGALDTLVSLPNGQRKHRVRVVEYPNSFAQCNEEERKFIMRMIPVPSLADSIGEDHLFYFSYDIFGEIQSTVQHLNDFIQNVKRVTGHDKVNLMPVSMGGTVLTAYMADYGAADDVHRVVAAVPAYNGSIIASDLLLGNIDADDYENLFIYLAGNRDGKKMAEYVRFVPKRIIKKLIHTLLEAGLGAVLTNSTTMWGLATAEAYAALRDKLLSDDAHQGIRKILDHYYETRRDLPAMVKQAQARGVEFFTLCGYDIPIFQAINTKDINSDGIIPTVSAGMGVQVAPRGQTLGADYKQQNLYCSDPSHHHISPDNVIDASTGPLPDTTWYFKGMGHEEAADDCHLLKIACRLLADASLKSVFDLPEYPQFLDYEPIEKKK